MLNRQIRFYSTQQIVWLNVDESYTFRLKDGADRVMRLVSVQDHRDSVVNFVRRSEVRVEIDGRPLDLVCMPYVMPTEAAGLRVQADTTSGYENISKQVQLSLWDATDPIVDTKRFVFPIRNFRLLVARHAGVQRAGASRARAMTIRRASDSTTIMDSTWAAMKAAKRSSAPSRARSSSFGPAARICARSWFKTPMD